MQSVPREQVRSYRANSSRNTAPCFMTNKWRFDGGSADTRHSLGISGVNRRKSAIRKRLFQAALYFNVPICLMFSGFCKTGTRLAMWVTDLRCADRQNKSLRLQEG